MGVGVGGPQEKAISTGTGTGTGCVVSPRPAEAARQQEAAACSQEQNICPSEQDAAGSFRHRIPRPCPLQGQRGADEAQTRGLWPRGPHADTEATGPTTEADTAGWGGPQARPGFHVSE